MGQQRSISLLVGNGFNPLLFVFKETNGRGAWILGDPQDLDLIRDLRNLSICLQPRPPHSVGAHWGHIPTLPAPLASAGAWHMAGTLAGLSARAALLPVHGPQCACAPCTDDDGARVLPPLEQACCSYRPWQSGGGGFRGSCTNQCHFSSWIQPISLPLLLTCSGGCVSAEGRSVAGFDVFCWFLVSSWGHSCLAIAVGRHRVMEPCPGSVLGAFLCVYTYPELPGWRV